MIGATVNRETAARRRWPAALAGLGIVALAATACGGAASTVAPLAAASGSPSPTASAAAFPGVVGTAAAVSGSSLEVQNPTSGQVTVTFSSTTPITETLTATSAAVTVGSCVAVTSQPAASGAAASTAAASTVTVSAPVKGKCSIAAGFGGGGGGFAPRPGSSASPRPSFSARPRPSGARGALGGADGAVTAVSASGFVVQRKNPAGGADTSITVTTTAATKYLTVVTAHPSALKVGQCVTAVGTANSIGAVAAKSIRISQPGPDGCVTTFGRRSGFETGSTGAAGNA
jgi:Domain of unknown function (DUF5666)